MIDHNFGIDSPISNKKAFDSTLRIVQEIDSFFEIDKSNTIDTTDEWQFICSYKKGWESRIRIRDSVHYTNFNDIYVSRKEGLNFTFKDLKELIPHNIKLKMDSLGNYCSPPLYTTDNYLIIAKGHSYPNGSQTSWAYSHKYYFIKKRVLMDSGTFIKSTTEPKIIIDQTLAPIDTVFIDFKSTPPYTKYQVFRATKDGKSGWMNVEGDWMVPPEFDVEFKRDWSEGVNICRKKDKYGAVNYKNEIVIPFIYHYPPANCSDGLILVKDSLNQEAYFSKQGVRITNFENKQPVFKNGFAVIRSNRNKMARYPRIDLENSDRTTEIYSGDFAVINTNFDTLLQFEKVSFLLEFGTLNNNRRTFFLYPYMGLHADMGVSYGQYGYLDGKGNMAIESKFRASDVFIPVRGGFVRDPNCPFNSNLAMVRELSDYYFIDTLGNISFHLHSNREQISDVSHFNNYGIAGYRSFGKSTNGTNPSQSRIHLIDSTGEVIHEAFERDAPLSYVESNLTHYPHNNLISIFDKKNAVQRIYTPAFKPFASFPLKDSSKTVNYHYRGLFHTQLDDQFILTQFKDTKHSNGYPGNQQRLIDKNGDAKSSWFSHKYILSSFYNNFSFVDSTTMTSTLYDFSKNVLFECDSCFFDYGYRLRSNGIYNVQLSNGDRVNINYQGKVLSELFDSFEEKVYNLTEQVKTSNTNHYNTISTKENEFIKLFNESVMYERIIK